jgi:S-formylglutathione hydrolase FrmB
MLLRRLFGRLERRLDLVPRKDRAAARRVDLRSQALGRKATFLAYVPAYARVPDRRLPVLYLLHGATGTWSDWSQYAHGTLRVLAHRHRLVLVTPEGGRGKEDGWYLDRAPGKGYRSHLLAEVLPTVEQTLPVLASRGIAGLSMGGHGALTLALQHPELFATASSMSGVLDLTAAQDREALRALLGPYPADPARWHASSAHHLVADRLAVARALPMLVTVGASDHWAPVNRAFHEHLVRLGVEHTFEERPGGHDWAYWTAQLERHARWHAGRLSRSQ